MLKIMSFNLRVDTPVDGIHSWEHRKASVTDFLSTEAADVFGFQEILPPMLAHLEGELPGYASVGDFRSPAGEGCPILYRRDKYALLGSETIWLSETPATMSTIAGSHFPRIATYAVLQAASSLPFLYCNTHLDYASDAISRRQLEVLLAYVTSIARQYGAAMIVGGDFNQTAGSQTLQLIENAGLISVFSHLDNPGCTFHDFGKVSFGLPIDHIYYDPSCRLMDAHILGGLHQGVWLSDHFPLVAIFRH